VHFVGRRFQDPWGRIRRPRVREDGMYPPPLLRHSDVKLTLQSYSHAVSQDRMAAAGEMLMAILSHAADQSGLGAD
jgi:hypothetical protein